MEAMTKVLEGIPTLYSSSQTPIEHVRVFESILVSEAATKNTFLGKVLTYPKENFTGKCDDVIFIFTLLI